MALTAACLLSLAATTPLRAQSDSRLVAAMRSAQEGQGDSARAAVQRLLDATPPTDTLYPEILYTQAMVAGEAAEMRRSLQRVVVEHGASSWADDALLRLVQMDYATRQLDAAARNLEKLRLDYPVTPLLPQAAYWGGRTYFDLNNPALACRWLADGIARAQENIELQNQLMFMHQRCGRRTDSVEAQPGDTARTGDTTAAAPKDTAKAPPAKAPQPKAQAKFRVQVSAVATPGAADDAASKVEALGYPAVIVRERGFYKVRAGAFATREEAQAAARKLKAQLGGSPFVVAAP
jgi:cell division septation protein DedD